MPLIKFETKNGKLLREFKSDYVPNIGDTIWLNNSIDNHSYIKITDKVIDLDYYNFIITFIVEEN